MATNWPSSVQTFTNPTSGSSLSSPSHADQHATVNDTVEALQNYAGLVFVKSVTIGSGVSSVTVTDAFDSRFDNYVVNVNIEACSSVGPYIHFRIGGSSTGYYGARIFSSYTSSTPSATTDNNSAQFSYLGPGASEGVGFGINVYDPYKARKTLIFSNYADKSTAGVAGSYSGMHNSSTSYTSCNVSVQLGTMTGGDIRVYGYNNGV